MISRRRALQVEGTASANTLMAGGCLVCLMRSQEAMEV